MKTGPTDAIRVVLLERHVIPSARINVYGRGLWASSKRAEAKLWVAGAGLVEDVALRTAKLLARSRSLAAVRDPMLAQEWAFAMWDEYLADVLQALGPERNALTGKG